MPTVIDPIDIDAESPLIRALARKFEVGPVWGREDIVAELTLHLLEIDRRYSARPLEERRKIVHFALKNKAVDLFRVQLRRVHKPIHPDMIDRRPGRLEDDPSLRELLDRLSPEDREAAERGMAGAGFNPGERKRLAGLGTALNGAVAR